MLTTEHIINLVSAEMNREEEKMIRSFDSMRCLLVEKEALSLYRLCKAFPTMSRILEIGSYQGTSAAAMGHAIAGTDTELYCIDPWQDYSNQGDFKDFDRSETADDFNIMKSFIRNTAFIGDNLRMMRGTSNAFAELLAGKDFDLIFIDGAHDYESVINDIQISFSALRPGGILCGHDFHTAGTGVMRAVNELIGGVATIPVKGVIEETSIWVAVVPDPVYEYRMTKICESMAAQQHEEALELALQLYKEYKKAEILPYIATIKTQLYSQNNRGRA